MDSVIVLGIQLCAVLLLAKIIGDFVIKMRHGHPPPQPPEDPIAQRIKAVEELTIMSRDKTQIIEKILSEDPNNSSEKGKE